MTRVPYYLHEKFIVEPYKNLNTIYQKLCQLLTQGFKIHREIDEKSLGHLTKRGKNH